MSTITEVLNHFRSEIGFVEGPAHNENKYAAEAGHANGYAWCATFVVAMFRRAGMTLPSESAWTPSMYAGLKNQGGSIPAPSVGALCFLYSEAQGRIAHVGIVESLRKDGRFVTIEGNTDSAGGNSGGRVMRKVRAKNNWVFAMPAYDRPTPPAKKPTTDNMVERIQSALDVTTDGMWGPVTDVRARRMQTAALAKCGYPKNQPRPFDIEDVQSVIGTEVDGIWGPLSQGSLETWVELFQEVIGTTSDGMWGPTTNGRFKAIRRKYYNNY